MRRWQLANEVGVSDSTIERWETGESTPSPDDIGNIEKALRMPGLWHKWMLSNYDSYRERYTDVPENNNLTEIVVRMKHELSDVIPFIDTMELDSLNGRFDNREACKGFKKEALEAVAAIQKALERMPDDI